MLFLARAALTASAIVLLASTSTFAADEVGEAVRIKTSVTGDDGDLIVKSPVYRDERIQTSHSGLGEFVFRDGTKLAVGWGSSVVIDQFVYNDSNSLQKLTINATKGTFRWISGSSDHSAYEIVTPAGTLGVRGTAFDFYVGENGETAVVLLNGAVQFCTSTGCKDLTKRCDAFIATPNTDVTDPQRANRRILKTLGDVRALSFLTRNQQLTKPFRANDGDCNLVAVAPLEIKPALAPRLERTKSPTTTPKAKRSRTRADANPPKVKPPKHQPPDDDDDDGDDDDGGGGHHGNHSHDSEHGHHGHDDDHGQG